MTPHLPQPLHIRSGPIVRRWVAAAGLLAVVCMGGGPLAAQAPAYAVPQVPQQLTWCGIELQLTLAARQRVQQYVDYLHAKPYYFQAMVEKAAVYLPHVRDGLRQVGVPEDLQYLVIQESGFRGDAVSSSNAVGFWQFKDFTAREVGLQVDDAVDERKHISRASAGAARYLYKNNLWFNNWLYATIAYMTGPTGALPYVDPKYYAARRMPVDTTLHWYAMKALAHKVAFAAALRSARPALHLEAKTVAPGESIWALLAREQLSAEQFRTYNLWLTTNRLTGTRPVTYFVPRKLPPADTLLPHVGDPHLASLFPPANPNPSYFYPRVPPPAPAVAATTATQQAPATAKPGAAPAGPVRLTLAQEPLYNREFAYLQPGETLVQLAQRVGIALSRLHKWNEWGNAEPAAGSLVLLVPPRKATVHLAQANETLAMLGLRYGRPSQVLAEWNGLTDIHAPLVPGRKLYLAYAAPAGAVPQHYELPAGVTKPADPTPPAVAQADTTQVRPQVPLPAGPATLSTAPASMPVYQPYTVAKGDTLFSIARRFGMSIHELRRVNGITNDDLRVGSSLLVAVPAP